MKPLPDHIASVPTLICRECGNMASVKVTGGYIFVEERHTENCSHATEYELKEDGDDFRHEARHTRG